MKRSIHVDRRFIVLLFLAWASVAGGFVAKEPGLILAGAFLGGVAGFGAVVPPRPALHVDFKTNLPTLTEGDTFTVEAMLQNQKRALLAEWKLRLPGVARADGGATHGFALLHAHGKTRFTAQVSILLFGLHRLGPMDLRIGDPFGFTFVEETLGTPEEMRVYPRYEGLGDTVVRSRQQRPLMGRYEITQPGHGMEFYGLRGYMHGDRPRDINWKASSRSDTIIVNQHERETNTEIAILVDVRAGTQVGHRLESPFAQGCRAALSLADAHLGIQDPVRFMAYGDGVKTDRHTGSTRRMQGILDILVGLEPKGATPLGVVVHDILPHLRPHTPVFVVSCLVGDDTVREALILLKSHNFPVAVLVPVPAWGDKPSLADEVWQSRQDQMLAALRASGMPVARLEAGQAMEQTMLQLEVLR